MNRFCINAIALWNGWARGCADVRCITNRQYGDLKSEGGGDDLRMCHWLTTMPRPREIEVDGGQYRRGLVTVLPGNQVRRGSEQPDWELWMPRDRGAEKISGTTFVNTTVHR